MTRSSQQWSVRAGALAIAAVLIAQGPPITGQRAESKLATTLADLVRAVPQDTSAIGEPGVARPLTASALPASVQDAAQGRQLRIDDDGSVQVYILHAAGDRRSAAAADGRRHRDRDRRRAGPSRAGARAGVASAAARVARVRRFRPRADVRPHRTRAASPPRAMRFTPQTSRARSSASTAPAYASASSRTASAASSRRSATGRAPRPRMVRSRRAICRRRPARETPRAADVGRGHDHGEVASGPTAISKSSDRSSTRAGFRAPAPKARR